MPNDPEDFTAALKRTLMEENGMLSAEAERLITKHPATVERGRALGLPWTRRTALALRMAEHTNK